jgi:hypothetical protein
MLDFRVYLRRVRWRLAQRRIIPSTPHSTICFGKQEPERVPLLDQTSLRVPPGIAAMTQFGGKAQTLLKDVPKEAKDDFDSHNKSHAKIEGKKIKPAFEMVSLSTEEAGKLVEAAVDGRDFTISIRNRPSHWFQDRA